ncbi:MAG: ABC transporter permease [Cytophagales bacterium]
MNASYFIAKRYFISKKKSGFINVISIISMLSITFATAALVVVLSALNGMEELLRSMFTSFDPDLVVSIKEGKSFEFSDSISKNISNLKGVKGISRVVEDNALLKYRDKQMIVRMKGVDKSFLTESGFSDYIIYGNTNFEDSLNITTVLGRGVQFRLSVVMEDEFSVLQLIYPKNKAKINLNPEKAFNIQNLIPKAVFAIEKQYDDNYIIVPINVAKQLMDYGERITAIEVYLNDQSYVEKVQSDLKKKLGEKFKVLNSDEQHSSLLKAVKIEKLIVYFIFTLIIAISSFSIYLSLSMLVLEKKKDIKSLFLLGASSSMIQNLFIGVGVFVALSGASFGIFLGLTLCWVQQTFGLVSMGMQTSVIDAYPVTIYVSDIVLSFATISIISILASISPSKKATLFIK